MLGVEISTATVGSLQDHEFIKASSWIRFMDESQQLQLLFGNGIRTVAEIAPTLETFWERFRHQYPSHQIFERADAGKLKLAATLPLMFHADEGRTLKRKPLLICQFSMVFGTGAGRHNSAELLEQRSKQQTMLVNAKGSTLRTRFLLGLMHRNDYAEDPANLDSLIELLVQDFQTPNAG